MTLLARFVTGRKTKRYVIAVWVLALLAFFTKAAAAFFVAALAIPAYAWAQHLFTTGKRLKS